MHSTSYLLQIHHNISKVVSLQFHQFKNQCENQSFSNFIVFELENNVVIYGICIFKEYMMYYYCIMQML